jgi:hypothetical protein
MINWVEFCILPLLPATIVAAITPSIVSSVWINTPKGAVQSEKISKTDVNKYLYINLLKPKF